MKTAEEVADKLITVNLLKLETFRDALIKALTAFAEERVKEHEEELICEDCGYAGSQVKPSLSKARAEALEEAAETISDAGWNSADEVINAKRHTECLAEIIRALKEKQCSTS